MKNTIRIKANKENEWAKNGTENFTDDKNTNYKNTEERGAYFLFVRRTKYVSWPIPNNDGQYLGLLLLQENVGVWLKLYVILSDVVSIHRTEYDDQEWDNLICSSNHTD